MVENKQESKTEVEVTEVVTETKVAFKLPNGDVVGLEQYLVWLGNQLLAVKAGIVGK